MGTVRTLASKGEGVSGLPYIREMMAHTARMLGIETFVETGTEYGDTAEWASGLFRRVLTIEASRDHLEKAANRLGSRLSPEGNVTLIHGDSAVEIRGTVLRMISHAERALFWLDAQWSTDDTYYGKNEDNPLIIEIRDILAHSTRHVIVVDDVRMFAYPYYVPKGSTQHNPSMVDIVNALPGYQVGVYADAYVAIPGGDAYEVFESWRQRIKKTELDILS